MSLQTPRLFTGKVHHVHAVSIVDLMIQTPFDVSFTHRCILHKVPKVAGESSRLFNDAKQCAIILIGGKDVIVETVPVPKRANMIAVSLYIKGTVPPTDCNVTIDDVDYIYVNRYLEWLSTNDRPFDKSLVSRHKRGMA